MSSISQIPAHEADKYMLSYYNAILQKQPDQSISNYFKWESAGMESKLLGFSVPLLELGIVNQLVGTDKMVFSFGLRDVATSTSPRFALFLQAVNDNGSIRSEYFELTTPFSANDVAFNPYSQTGSTHNSIPIILFNGWTSVWETMPDANLTTSVCSIDLANGITTSSVPLRKYIFNMHDVLNTLYGIAEADVSKCTLFIWLVSHSAIKLNDDGAPIPDYTKKSTIGLALGVAKMDESDESDEKKYTIISSCYDFSAPCPPTCPGF